MINWIDIANAINQATAMANQNQQVRGLVIQPWQRFLMPLQINSNAPDVLMQQARDTNENYYYNYIQGITANNINNTILFAAAGIMLFYLFAD